MRLLPPMRHPDGITKRQTVVFSGYNHTEGAGDGALRDMTNLTGEDFPVLSSRHPRYRVGTPQDEPQGLYGGDDVFLVSGGQAYVDGLAVGTVSSGRKHFATLGAWTVILPDKAAYNRLTGEWKMLEKTWTGAVTLQDGTFADQTAKANTITATGVGWAGMFSVGDAVTISGCTAHPANNQTIIIREIDGGQLRFYENSFQIGEGGDQESAVTLSRTVPDLDFLCSNENRLWGCKGDTIYASKLGDPFNWNVFDGLPTDSYAVNVGSAGDFTACTAYLGYPVFFKEENIYKVYGNKPSNFQVMGSASLGVAAGSDHSCAVAGEVLFYLSRTGIMAYSGGVPQSVSAAFGSMRFSDAVGGSDGTKYHVSMREAGSERWHYFVYDTRIKQWFREDDRRVVGFAWVGDLYFLDGNGQMWLDGTARQVPPGVVPEGPVESSAEFADFVEGSANKKGTSKLQLRIALEPGASLAVEIQFDSSGVWEPVKTLTATTKRSFYLPILPKRSDHFRIRLRGVGGWKLYSLVRENYIGSEL